MDYDGAKSARVNGWLYYGQEQLSEGGMMLNINVNWDGRTVPADGRSHRSHFGRPRTSQALKTERRDRLFAARDRLDATWTQIRESCGGISSTLMSSYVTGRVMVPLPLLEKIEALQSADLPPSRLRRKSADRDQRRLAVEERRRSMEAFAARRASEVERRLKSGETLEQIGNHFGVTRERIRQIAAKDGIIWNRRVDIAGQRARLRDEMRRSVMAARGIARINQDQRLRHLVVNEGISIRQARAVVGLKIDQGGDNRCKGLSKHGRWTLEALDRQAKILPLFESGKSIWEIAEELGGTADNARSFLARHGIEMDRADARLYRQKKDRPARIARPPRQPKAVKPKTPSDLINLKHSRNIPLATPDDVSNVWPLHVLDCMVACWRGGQSAAAIAKVLGRPYTRSSVLGKLNRMRQPSASQS